MKKKILGKIHPTTDIEVYIRWFILSVFEMEPRVTNTDVQDKT